jgi:hypothetical protein
MHHWTDQAITWAGAPTNALEIGDKHFACGRHVRDGLTWEETRRRWVVVGTFNPRLYDELGMIISPNRGKPHEGKAFSLPVVQYWSRPQPKPTRPDYEPASWDGLKATNGPQIPLRRRHLNPVEFLDHVY